MNQSEAGADQPYPRLHLAEYLPLIWQKFLAQEEVRRLEQCIGSRGEDACL